MPGSSYELYYPHMMPICARDDSYGSVMRIIGMSVCLRCRAGFGRLPRSRATSGRSAPSRRPNLARELSDCPNPARQRCECPNLAQQRCECPKVARQPAGVLKLPGNDARVRIPPESAPPSNIAPERGRRLPFRSDRLRSGFGKTREGVKKSVLNLEKQSVST